MGEWLTTAWNFCLNLFIGLFWWGVDLLRYLLELADNIFLIGAACLRDLLTWAVKFMGVSTFWVELVMVFVYFAAILAVIMVAALVLMLAERKISAFIQLRHGPNRVGFWGLLQPIADMFKLLTKENIIPRRADKAVFILAPAIVIVPTIMAYSVIPFGKGMVAVDLNIGVFYVFAVSSLTTIPFIMAGWSANNKYSLLGGMRAVAQMVSYEIPLVFSLLGVVMITGTLQLSAIVEAQKGLWFIFLQPVAFVIYLIAATAECNRTPFDIPEGESELTAGVYTEYTGIKWALFMMTEYGNLVLVSAVATTMFLGGWQGPLLPGWFWFGLKTALFIFFFMWIRWTFPRIRIDQLMSFGWKILIPLSLANVLLTGLGIYLFSMKGW